MGIVMLDLKNKKYCWNVHTTVDLLCFTTPHPDTKLTRLELKDSVLDSDLHFITCEYLGFKHRSEITEKIFFQISIAIAHAHFSITNGAQRLHVCLGPCNCNVYAEAGCNS